jgi:hypothetical protein
VATTSQENDFDRARRGINGVPQQNPFGDMTTVTFSPNIGIILAVAGCGAAFVAAIMSFHHRQD